MNTVSYKPTDTTLVSIGKRDIIKSVEFTPTLKSNVYNLAFGDTLPNGELDDTTVSNNGDIIKIFATVIDILPRKILIYDIIYGKYPHCELYYIGAS